MVKGCDESTSCSDGLVSEKGRYRTIGSGRQREGLAKT